MILAQNWHIKQQNARDVASFRTFEQLQCRARQPGPKGLLFYRKSVTPQIGEILTARETEVWFEIHLPKYIQIRQALNARNTLQYILIQRCTRTSTKQVTNKLHVLHSCFVRCHHVMATCTCAILFVLCLGREAGTTRRTQWVGVGQFVTVQGLLSYEALLDQAQTRGVLFGCIFYSSRIG